MNNEDGGSVGYIGNSRHGWYDPEVPPGEGPSDLYDREFFNITFNESAYRLGEVVGYSKVRYIPLSQEDGNAMRWLQYAINILGDPELPIRTDTPRNFLISMPSQIPSRKQTLVISVSEIGHDHGSVQVRNATVCILKSGEVYNVSKTDASGLAEFTIDPDAGVLEVTVTKENYHVYEGVIDIYSPDIYVNTTGWWRDGGAFYANGTPIQSAVDGADVGETIFVRNGSYTENVDADKTLTLRGEGADVVTVTAADSGDHVFEVSADRVNISGFAVSGAVDGYRTAGVYLNDTDHCDISRNNASNNDYGICLYSSDNNTLTDNIASNNDHGIYLWYSSNNNNLTKNNASSNGNGIKLSDSRNNTLASNIASNNHFGIWLIGDSNNNTLASNTANFNSHHGIYLIFSSNNTLTNNTISKNKCNFGVYGSSLSEHIQSIDASNMVDEKPIYYWVNQEDETIPCDAGFVGVVNCTNITVRDQTLMKNRGGVLFAYTNDSRIVNVTSGSNEYHGICLLSSSNNTLANNTVSKNVCGIYMYRSSNNTLEKNTASNNHGSGWTIIHGYPDGNSITIPCGGDGIFLDFSSNNSITCNLLQNNTNRGVYLKGESTNNKISCNNIIENGNYNATTSGYEWQLFHFLQTDDIDASDNWWGTTNDDIINASIYGWNGNSDVSNATYLPKLGQPAPCAPTPDEPPAFTTTDAVIALQISVGSRPPDPRWDVRRDDSVTSLDALMILQAAAGAIEL
jgi:parallel beta-helix repeat protein